MMKMVICQGCHNTVCVHACKPVEVDVPTKYVGRPLPKSNEPDLLVGHEQDTLTIGSVEFQAPKSGWTHELIERRAFAYESQAKGSEEPWDIYLGSQWVGGSEI